MATTINIEDVPQATLDLLLYSEVEAGNISEEVFAANLEMVTENPGFGEALAVMASDENTKFICNGMLAQGPEALLKVLGMLVNSGAVSKQQVRASTGIKKVAKTQKSWSKLIAEPMCAAMYEAAQKWYADNLAANRKTHGDFVPEEFHDFFRQVGKSTLSVGVDKMEHPESGQECSLAVVFRIDHNSSARNGTKKAEESEDTDSNGV
tara:strand:+ start:13579 stop:14202 length:624 start_codon:yes stop_codon:yes gene_type:complete